MTQLIHEFPSLACTAVPAEAVLDPGGAVSTLDHTGTVPWLTVIIPVHNGAPLIEMALAGIAAEHPQGVEVLIFNSADDGGAAKQIADRFTGKIAITWHERPDLSNWTFKVNEGARLARAPHIAVLCHDDFWLPGHLASLRTALAQYPEAAMSIAASRFSAPDGLLLGPWGLPYRAGLISGQTFGETQLVQCTVAINGAVFRRELFLAAGGLDERLWYPADWDLFLKMAKLGSIGVRSAVTTAYRVHPGAQTVSASRDIADFRRQLETVFYRHVGDFTSPGSQIDRRARVSIEVNCALALAASGRLSSLPRTVLRLLSLGPRQFSRLLNETRLIDRMRPRLRLALAGGF